MNYNFDLTAVYKLYLMNFCFSGWAMKVTAGQSLLSVEVSYSQRSNTTSVTTAGLLGIFDDEKDNDLTPPEGAPLLSDAKEREIYYQFGQKCK